MWYRENARGDESRYCFRLVLQLYWISRSQGILEVGCSSAELTTAWFWFGYIDRSCQNDFWMILEWRLGIVRYLFVGISARQIGSTPSLTSEIYWENRFQKQFKALRCNWTIESSIKSLGLELLRDGFRNRRVPCHCFSLGVWYLHCGKAGTNNAASYSEMNGKRGASSWREHSLRGEKGERSYRNHHILTRDVLFLHRN